MRERLKRSLSGRPWIQVWLPGRRRSARLPWRARLMARSALGDHQHADDAEQRDIGEADDQIELAELAQQRKQPDAESRADGAADQQHGAEREVDRARAANRPGSRWPSEAAICGATLATTTAGEMPMKISSGVIRKPPPMPNMPEMKPTASPIPRMRKTSTGRLAIGR